MSYSKLYYALLEFKKVVISTYFNMTIYMSLSSLTISLCILSTRFFLLRFFVFFCFLASSHIFCLSTLESCVFFFSLQLDLLLLICTTWTQNNTNIVKRNYNSQNPNICPIFLPLQSRLQKKICKYFVLLMNVIVLFKNGVFY